MFPPKKVVLPSDLQAERSINDLFLDVYNQLTILTPETGGLISNIPYSSQWMGDITHAPSKNAVYNKIASLTSIHDPVSINANAGTILGLADQDLFLHTQVANRIFSGPSSGANAVPTFRAMVDADFPATLSPTITGLKVSGLTAGYLPYHVSLGTGLGNSPVYTDGSLVGIGNLTPGSRLDISGVTTTGASLRLRSGPSNNTNYIGLKAPDTVTASVTYTWPVMGTVGYMLTLGASGVLSWESGPGSGMTDPMTTAGDMIFKNSAAATTRLAVGGEGQILTSHTDGTAIVPTWMDAATGLTIGGDDSPVGQVQYRASGNFAANDYFYFDAGSNYELYIIGGKAGAKNLNLRNTNTGVASSSGINIGNNTSADELYIRINSSNFTDAASYSYVWSKANAPMIFGTNNLEVFRIEGVNLELTTLDGPGLLYINSLHQLSVALYTGSSSTVVMDTLPTITGPTFDVGFFVTYAGGTYVTVDGASTIAKVRFIQAGTADLVSFEKTTNTAASPASQIFMRARTGPVIVEDVDRLGQISFKGYTGAAYANAAQIRVEVNGTPTATAMPGRILFLTTPAGSTTLTESVVVTPSGQLGIRDRVGSFYTYFKAGTQAVDLSYTLPTAQGAANSYFKNDGAGVLSWGTLSNGDMLRTTYDPDVNGVIAVGQGGTNKATWTTGAIPYLTGATTFGEIGIGAIGTYLKVNPAGTGYTWDNPTVSGSNIRTYGVTVYNPIEGINLVVWYAPFACTVTHVRGYRVGGSAAGINARRNHSGYLNHLSSTLALAEDVWTDDSGVQNTSYAIGDWLEVMIVSQTGNPTQVVVQVEFTS